MYLIILIMLYSATQQTDYYEQERKNMVHTQLVSRGVSSKTVLDAFYKVPRHEFVPNELKDWAYADHPLPIGEEQTISQPYIVAFMTEILNLKPGEKVLEIGTGSGYQAAILAETGALVYSIEIFNSLATQAKKTLNALGYKNINLKTGNGYVGWTEFAPFDAILVTCSPTAVPEPLKQQLAEGGRMVIPVGKKGSVQSLFLLEKKNGKTRQTKVLPVRFVPMINENGINY